MPSIETYENELTAHWAGRDDQIKQDRNLIALKKPPKVPGFVQIILNKPKVLYDTSVSILSSFEPVMRLPLESPSQTDEIREKMSKAERLIIGGFREVDNHQHDMGKPSWIYELAYWACSGWITWMPYIDNCDGEVKFTCPFFDPLTVYPLWTNDGMEVVLRRYWTTVGAAKRMAEKHGWQTNLSNKNDTLSCKVVSLWESEGGKIYNTIAFQGFTAKEREETEFAKIPLKIIPVAGTVEGPVTEGDKGPVQRRGESIIAMNRDVYGYQNLWTSFAIQFLQDVAYPGILDITETGEAVLKPDQIGSGKIHHRKINEPIELLRHAGAEGLSAIMLVLNSLNVDEQKGGLPAIVQGSIPFEISGFMGSQLFAAVKYRMNPRMEAMKYVISSVATEFLRQFKAQSKSVTLSVTESSRDRKRLGKGETFMEDFSPKDVPPTTYVDVDIPLATMVDKAQQMSWARQALAEPQLVSRETLWEDELGIQDIDQEKRRIDADQVDSLPGVRLIKAVERLKSMASDLADSGDIERGQAFFNYAAYLESQIPGKQQQPQQQQQGGPGPAELPSEFGATGMSPDMTNAMAGQQPPGGTPGARTRGAEARSGLVNQFGKPF